MAKKELPAHVRLSSQILEGEKVGGARGSGGGTSKWAQLRSLFFICVLVGYSGTGGGLPG